MQPGQVRDQFSRIKQCIENANQACRSVKDVPDALRTSLGELDRASDQAMHVVTQTPDEQGIGQCVDQLEQLGDRMMEACKQSGAIDWDVQSAVRDAHDAIAELKHQLH